MSFANFKKEIINKLQDHTPKLENIDVDVLIVSVLVGQFSKDFPSIVVSDIAGDGGFDYDLPSTPTAKAWVDGFSQICAIEFPAGEQIPTYMEVKDYIIYDNGTEKQLRFLVDVPSATQTIRMIYIVPYSKATIDNIPTTKQEAYCLLAAAELCDMLARLDTESIDPTIEADSVNHHEKTNKWTKNGNEMRKKYNRLVGANKDGVIGASSYMDWDLAPLTRDDTGQLGFAGDYLYHRRRWR